MGLVFYNERSILIWAQYSTMGEVFLYGLSILQRARYSYMGLVFYNERGIPNVLNILQ